MHIVTLGKQTGQFESVPDPSSSCETSWAASAGAADARVAAELQAMPFAEPIRSTQMGERERPRPDGKV